MLPAEMVAKPKISRVKSKKGLDAVLARISLMVR
jgi:hypothetical protein